MKYEMIAEPIIQSRRINSRLEVHDVPLRALQIRTVIARFLGSTKVDIVHF
jgi:hypothetical protein